jgi:hypothetical protein
VRQVVPFGALVRTLAASALATAPLFAIREAAAGSGLRLAVAALVFGLLAPLCLRASRSISDDDWRRLRGAWTELIARRRIPRP